MQTLRPPLELRNATRMLGRLRWRDRHLGEPIFSGELALSVGTAESWQGSLSISACDAAEHAMVGRRPLGQFTDAQLLQAARVAFDFDAHFYGLDVDWDTARLEALDGGVVRVGADVRWADLLAPDDRMAMVRLEIVDYDVTYAEWQLSDGDGIAILEAEELDAAAHTSPSIDSMAWFCQQSLAAGLARRHLPPVSYWQMRYSVMTSPDGRGSCGEMRLWTILGQP
jgi:hypothetical protein